MAGAPSIVVVGGGNMGRALVAGWRAEGVPAAAVRVVEPDAARAAEFARAFGVATVATPTLLADADRPDVVVFAVKPQAMAAVVPAYARFADAEVLFLSIVAGAGLDAIAARLGRAAAIVRAMPNTPARVRRGITVLCANAVVSPEQRARAAGLMAAVGAVEWVEDEGLLDPATAISGSGPAYVFLLSECLAAAGAAAGLPPTLADRLARQTVIGAGALLEGAAESAETLRWQVTSPGGTTAAALAILEGDAGLRPLMLAAVRAATARARALGAEAAGRTG